MQSGLLLVILYGPHACIVISGKTMPWDHRSQPVKATDDIGDVLLKVLNIYFRLA